MADFPLADPAFLSKLGVSLQLPPAAMDDPLQQLNSHDHASSSSLFFNHHHHQGFLEAQMDHCSSSAVLDHHCAYDHVVAASQPAVAVEAAAAAPAERKRKGKEAAASTAQTKSKEMTKNRRLTRLVGGDHRKAALGKDEEDVKMDMIGEEKSEEKDQQQHKGYIHVRARRGQATDSHSLAERVRREKISERMRMLQALVPGCDKVTGKALVLDEIINYVQSLQNQVEFLSMRIASLSPVMYGFGMDLEGYSELYQKYYSIFQEQVPMPNILPQSTPMQTMMEPPSAPCCLQGQEAAVSFSQESGSFLIQPGGGGDQRQDQLSQMMLHNICSFQ